MSDIADLVEWLRAQLDEDERVALAAPRYNWTIYLAGDPETGEETERRVLDHVIRHDPESVLGDVAAKREILKWAERWMPIAGMGGVLRGEVERLVRLMASAYHQRPGYREEWRP